MGVCEANAPGGLLWRKLPGFHRALAGNPPIIRARPHKSRAPHHDSMETHFTGSLQQALNGGDTTADMPHHSDSDSDIDEQVMDAVRDKFAPPTAKRAPVEHAKPIGCLAADDSDSERDDDDDDGPRVKITSPVQWVEVAVQSGSSQRAYTRALLITTNESGKYPLHGMSSIGKPVAQEHTVLVYVRVDLADEKCPFAGAIRKFAPNVAMRVKKLFVPLRCIFLDIGNASYGLVGVTGAMVTPQGGDLAKVLFGTGYRPNEMISFGALLKHRKLCDLTPLGDLKRVDDLLRLHGIISAEYDIATAPAFPGASPAADTIAALRTAINDKKRAKRKHDGDESTPRKRPSSKKPAERAITPEPEVNGKQPEPEPVSKQPEPEPADKPMDASEDRDATPVVEREVGDAKRDDRDETPVAAREEIKARPKARRRPASTAARAPWLTLRSADAPGNGDTVLVFDVASGHALAELALVTRLRQVQPHIAFDVTLAETKMLTVKCTEANYDAVVAVVNEACSST